MKEIAEDPTVQRVFERRTLTQGTANYYVQGVRFFCEYYNARPFELIGKFRALSEDQLVEEFGDFFAAVNRRVAPKTLWSWLPGIRAWLLENGVRSIDRVGREISKEYRRKVGKVRTLLKRDVVDKQEITRILKVCGKRERAIITTFASSGLRLSACFALQVKHFKDDLWNANLPCYRLQIPESLAKGGDPFFTFISSEAAEYIRDILLERVDQGEKIGPESYLFTVSTKRLERPLGQPLSPKRFENLWRVLCRRAELDMKPVSIVGFHPVGRKGGGVDLRSGVIYNCRVHSLRKFLKTSCSINGVDRMASEAFLGHTLTQFGIESIYDFATTKETWLRQEYLKVLGSVTFLKPLPALPVANGEARLRIERLTTENLELKNQLGDIEKRLDLLDHSTHELIESRLRIVDELRKHGLVTKLS